MKRKHTEKLKFDKIIKKVEVISDKVNVIMQNRLIIAFFLIVDGITFILNPNATLPEMARNIIMILIFASLSVLIANLVAKIKDVKTIIISIVVTIVGIIAYIYPDFISAYIQLLLSLFIIYGGVVNIAKILNWNWLSKFTQAVRRKYNKIFNRKTIDKEKKAQKEKFKEVDDNINQGLEQQGEKLLVPIKSIINRTSKFSVLYIIANVATIILGIVLLIFPDVSIVVWGIVFLYTGLSNFFIAIKTMNLSKKIKEKKFKEIIFDADKGGNQKQDKSSKKKKSK